MLKLSICSIHFHAFLCVCVYEILSFYCKTHKAGHFPDLLRNLQHSPERLDLAGFWEGVGILSNWEMKETRKTKRSEGREGKWHYPKISAWTLYFQKLQSLAYIFAAYSMGLSSFIFVQWLQKTHPFCNRVLAENVFWRQIAISYSRRSFKVIHFAISFQPTRVPRTVPPSAPAYWNILMIKCSLKIISYGSDLKRIFYKFYLVLFLNESPGQVCARDCLLNISGVVKLDIIYEVNVFHTTS